MNAGGAQKNPPGRRDFYRTVAPVYDLLAGPFLRPVRNDVRRIAAVLAPARILDIACGTGEQARMLAGDGFAVTGVDLSPAMLAQARRKGAGAGAYFLGDARHLPFAAGSFDLVTIMLAMHEMDYESALKVMRESLRVLDRGGTMIVFDYVRGRGLVSRASLRLFHAVERMAGRRHFRNFRSFVQKGGLEALIAGHPLEVLLRTGYFHGAMGLAVLEKMH